MFTQIAINNKARSIYVEVEDIDPADFEDAVMKVFAFTSRLGATSPVVVQEDSALNADPEPECEPESEE
ncbi:MAG: hypothetical protein K2K82_07765 [Muribaculaceae bacterium]|nr:hypothetical protein [Muribaculaceae bacterium]